MLPDSLETYQIIPVNEPKAFGEYLLSGDMSKLRPCTPEDAETAFCGEMYFHTVNELVLQNDDVTYEDIYDITQRFLQARAFFGFSLPELSDIQINSGYSERLADQIDLFIMGTTRNPVDRSRLTPDEYTELNEIYNADALLQFAAHNIDSNSPAFETRDKSAHVIMRYAAVIRSLRTAHDRVIDRQPPEPTRRRVAFDDDGTDLFDFLTNPHDVRHPAYSPNELDN